jgi:hypothetical protein
MYWGLAVFKAPFLQYFNYIVTVSVIDGGNGRKQPDDIPDHLDALTLTRLRQRHPRVLSTIK